MLRPENFFDLDEFEHKAVFEQVEYVWQALANLKRYLNERLTSNVQGLSGGLLAKTHVLYKGELIDEGFAIEPGDATKGGVAVYREGRKLAGAAVLYAGSFIFDDRVHIGKGSVVEPGALIKGPAIIGDYTEVRQGAYVRGHCLVGDRCVVGHTTEMKSSIMLNKAKAGHFAYIGDSILGTDANLGAGTKLANLKIIDREVELRIQKKVYPTGLRKLGAIIGDATELGCNTVTSPGTLLGKGCLVYPCASVPAGFYSSGSVISIQRRNVLSVRKPKRSCS
jgi:bifunctional N-acetylglucosamine-1-phosphate-uridyltransferase/glucosamine-1-phosphate-acetyltransferase GlmU-like protein